MDINQRKLDQLFNGGSVLAKRAIFKVARSGHGYALEQKMMCRPRIGYRNTWKMYVLTASVLLGLGWRVLGVPAFPCF